MNVQDYFDSIAEYWDNGYNHDIFARYAACCMGDVREGSSVLDIGCGTGLLFTQLLDAGASEIVGVDISPAMLAFAQDKFAADPRISLYNCDILDFDEPGFDAALIFNGYIYFKDKRALLKKVQSLLNTRGRFTVFQSHGCSNSAVPHGIVPEEICCPLGSAREDALLWQDCFKVDCICDTDFVYLISGIRK